MLRSSRSNGVDKPQMAIFVEHLEAVFAEDIQYYNLAITRSAIELSRKPLQSRMRSTPRLRPKSSMSIVCCLRWRTRPYQQWRSRPPCTGWSERPAEVHYWRPSSCRRRWLTRRPTATILWSMRARRSRLPHLRSGNETGSTAFKTNFGPSNPAMASDAGSHRRLRLPSLAQAQPRT